MGVRICTKWSQYQHVPASVPVHVHMYHLRFIAQFFLKSLQKQRLLQFPPATSSQARIFFGSYILRYGTALLGNTHQLLRILARQSFGQASTGCEGSRKLQKRLHVEVRTGRHLSLLAVGLEDVWEVKDRALQRKKLQTLFLSYEMCEWKLIVEWKCSQFKIVHAERCHLQIRQEILPSGSSPWRTIGSSSGSAAVIAVQRSKRKTKMCKPRQL